MNAGVVSAVKARVLLTLKYTDQFDFPLTLQEVWSRLPAGKGSTPVSIRQVAQALAELEQAGLIFSERGFWKPSPNSGRMSADSRRVRKNRSQQKIAEAENLFHFVSKLPWVLGLAVTGSVSMDNAAKNDDLDLMVITQKRRLWLVRPAVIAYAWLKGKRRSWQKEEWNSWCFNLWLDENHLGVPLANRNLYSAYEVFQVKWVFARQGTAAKFLHENRWAKNFLPNMSLNEVPETPDRRTNIPGSKFLTLALDLLNGWAYRIQLWYMRPHRTTEKVGPGYAFFHPRDTYAQITNYLKTTNANKF